MRRSVLRLGAGFAVTIAVFGVAGCGKDPFGPPTRVRSTASEETPEGAKTIFFVGTGAPKGETLVWATQAQEEANLNQVVFRVTGPAPNETQEVQPEIVRRAIRDGASGLLVVPGDSPELGKVLAEAQAQGIPVALIGRTVAAPEGAKPFMVVEHASFEKSAARIASTTLEDFKKTGRPGPGPALILVDKMTDSTSAGRVEALKAGALAAGFAGVIEVTVNGNDSVEAKKQVLEAVNAHPDAGVLLADDPETIRAASEVRQDLKRVRPLFIGGFVDFSVARFQVPVNAMSCFGQGRHELLGTYGVRAILSKLRGETVADRIEVKPAFQRVDPVEEPATPPAKAAEPAPTKP